MKTKEKQLIDAHLQVSIESAKEAVKTVDAYVSKITKTKIKLGDNFQKETNRIHLRRLFPYLKKEYRKLDKKELTKTEVLHELFGENETDITKLKVIFKHQNIV